MIMRLVVLLVLGFSWVELGEGARKRFKRQKLNFDGNVRNKVKMGEKHAECDDGETNIDIDWSGHPMNYTCYHPTTPILSNNLPPVLECEDLAPDYQPQHFCMTTKISYDHPIPHHGNHRPIWPKFGEYQFVPPQRWLHNIEHGAVVMLYHPCAHPAMVEKLRKLVTGCIRKHVITPYTNIPEDKPLALVAWGCRMLMSSVDEVEVTNFIREKGLHGPEGDYPKEGQFTKRLIKLAEIPAGSDNEDSVLCPNYI